MPGETEIIASQNSRSGVETLRSSLRELSCYSRLSSRGERVSTRHRVTERHVVSVSLCLCGLTGNALVIVLRAEALEERQGLRERLDPLHRPVRHVGGRLAEAID